MSLQLKSSIISSIYFFILLNNWISLHQLVKCEINNNAVEKEQILTSKLLANYNKRLRPSRTVQVKFALNLNQIIKLVEKDQIFMLNVFDQLLKRFIIFKVILIIFYFKGVYRP